MATGDELGSTLVEGQKINFAGSNQLTYIRSLGRGGTGSTYLFRDEIADMPFAIKKFDPTAENDKEECFRRFVEEAKMLLHLAHKNIVRVYTYYLYPSQLCGFLQMEYIDGVPINEFHADEHTKSWNDIFLDTISAFEEMENCGILHRDVRPSNVLIDNYGEVKVIDFGFGKDYATVESLDNNSIALNWPYSAPDEIVDFQYNRATEVYYVGKLFVDVVEHLDNAEFDYGAILSRMTEKDPANRFSSFQEVKQEISGRDLASLQFTSSEKKAYLDFADELTEALKMFLEPPKLKLDPAAVLGGIKSVLEASVLEDRVQDNRLVINCFVQSGYRYSTSACFWVSSIANFYKLLSESPSSKKDIILRNISTRLGKVKVKANDVYDDDIPF